MGAELLAVNYQFPLQINTLKREEREDIKDNVFRKLNKNREWLRVDELE